MKRAIVAASFGVGDIRVKERCIDTLLADVRQAFGDRAACVRGQGEGQASPAGDGFEVVEAWTSAFLRKKMAREGYDYPSLVDVLEQLSAAGYSDVVIMPTHLTAGEEFQNKLVPAAREFAGRFDSLSLMEPVFAVRDAEDFAFLTADVLGLSELMPDEALVFMGHGSPHQHNPVYELLQQYVDSRGWRVHIGVVEPEDYPGKEDVLKRLAAHGVRKVYLRPLLLAGGSHALHDLAGDSPASWKSVLQAAGFSVRCSTKGLGEYAAFRRLYVQKLQRLAGLHSVSGHGGGISCGAGT
ncbi:sirohydrochlorin cobaltochelatase [Anaerovibrio sp.]|uniref:sirohydrochlorin cobaltochelatase n=1 Tax=Anaerovibrio sp. TaxID=1872532 RepID=UPI003F144772